MIFVKRTMVAIAVLLIAASIIFYTHIVVFVFAGLNNLNISYKGLKARSLTEFAIEKPKVIERKSHIGISASGATVKLLFAKEYPRNIAADFVLKDAYFIKAGAEKETSYNNIDGLLAMPFSNLLSYRSISGKVSPAQDGISIKDFLATGDAIKFSFDGLLTRANNIDAAITIYFAENLTKKMPPELTNMVLKDAKDGWKSFSVRLEGDLTKPSIKVTGRLFRLNIGVKNPT